MKRSEINSRENVYIQGDNKEVKDNALVSRLQEDKYLLETALYIASEPDCSVCTAYAKCDGGVIDRDACHNSIFEDYRKQAQKWAE